MATYARKKNSSKTIHAHWIHDRVENKSSVKGYFILPGCVCSSCGTPQPSEREKCPRCGAIMDEPSE